MSGSHPLAVGLDPSNDEARRWLEDELKQGAYNPQPSWWDKLGDMIDRWFSNLFGNMFDSTAGPVPLIVSIVIALLILAGATYLVSRLRRNRRATDPAGADRAVLGSATLSAAEYRRLATEAFDGGDYFGSVLNSMRAIAQEAVERTLLTRARSLTAHEIAYRLIATFPTMVNELISGADVFDDIAYGGRTATRDDAAGLRALDAKLKSTKPRLSDDVDTARPSLPPISAGSR